MDITDDKLIRVLIYDDKWAGIYRISYNELANYCSRYGLSEEALIDNLLAAELLSEHGEWVAADACMVLNIGVVVPDYIVEDSLDYMEKQEVMGESPLDIPKE